MIFDSIDNKSDYYDKPLLKQIFTLIDSFDSFSDIKANTIEEDILFYNPIELVTKDEEVLAYEAHKKYIDIHYIMEGHERININNVANLTPATPYDEQNDFSLFTGNSKSTCILSPGNFVILFPHEAHMVGVIDKVSETVKKVVFKLNTNSF